MAFSSFTLDWSNGAQGTVTITTSAAVRPGTFDGRLVRMQNDSTNNASVGTGSLTGSWTYLTSDGTDTGTSLTPSETANGTTLTIPLNAAIRTGTAGSETDGVEDNFTLTTNTYMTGALGWVRDAT